MPASWTRHDERRGGAVEDRDLGAVHLDAAVVDPHAVERGHHVLDRVRRRRRPVAEVGGERRVDDVLVAGGDLDAEVHPHEAMPASAGGGRERQRRRLAGVQARPPCRRPASPPSADSSVPFDACPLAERCSPESAPFRAIDVPINRNLGQFRHIAAPANARVVTRESPELRPRPTRPAPLRQDLHTSAIPESRHPCQTGTVRHRIRGGGLYHVRTTDESSARDPTQGRQPHRADAGRHVRARRGERPRVPLAAPGRPRASRRSAAARSPTRSSRSSDIDPRDLVPPPLTILTSMFLHGGLAPPRLQHALPLDLREQRRGRARARRASSRFYLLAGIAAALAQTRRVRGGGRRARPDGRRAGRSPACSPAYIVLFPRARVLTRS